MTTMPRAYVSRWDHFWNNDIIHFSGLTLSGSVVSPAETVAHEALHTLQGDFFFDDDNSLADRVASSCVQ